jgi:hypothetical protein
MMHGWRLPLAWIDLIIRLQLRVQFRMLVRHLVRTFVKSFRDHCEEFGRVAGAIRIQQGVTVFVGSTLQSGEFF